MKRILFLSLIISSVAIAEPKQSGPFNLIGGDLNPRSNLNILLDSLPSGGIYIITCDISNSSYSSPVVFQMYAQDQDDYSNFSVAINGKNAISFAGKYQMATATSGPNNKLIVSGYVSAHKTTSDYLGFYNFDTSAAISFQNCQANFLS